MPFKLGRFVRALFKGVGHRYIKRIPYMTPKGQRYRYIYKVEHTHQGKHAFDEAHLVEGTKFALSTESGAEFHGHITAVDGDKVTYTIDDGPRKGQVVETTKAELAAKLNEVHGYKNKLSAERAKVSALLEEMKAGSATEKQIARVRRRLLALGGVEKEAVTPEPEPVAESQLARDLIEKHSVTPEFLERKAKEFRFSGAALDRFMNERLSNLRHEGFEQASAMYNQALSRSAEENRAVLALIEEMRGDTHIDRNLQAKQKLRKLEALKEQKEAYKQALSDYAKENGVQEVYLPRMSETLNEYKERLRLAFRRDPDFVSEFYEGVESIVQEFSFMRGQRFSASELWQHFEKLNPQYQGLLDHRNTLDQQQLKSEERELARRAAAMKPRLVEALRASCAGILATEKFQPRPHKSHKLRTKSKLVGVAALRLAHVEDVFQAAYPERSSEMISIKLTKRKRAFQDPRDGSINLNKASLREASHELAHTLEGNHRGYSGPLTVKPYQVAIHQAVTMSHLTRVEKGQHTDYTGKGELCFNDQYSSLYAGKLYGDGASEFVSVGVENFFGNSSPNAAAEKLADFALRDPHHFLVTYAILKGYTKHE